MNVARLAVLGIAAGAGLFAWMLAGSGPEPEPQIVVEEREIDSVEVLVAAVDVGMGRTLSQNELRWQDWPSELANERFITKDNSPDGIEEIVGAITRQALVEGEPINTAKLARYDRGFMSAILPKGMRAISTEISPETGAGGFILPNDRVDVILTKRDRSAEDSGGSEAYISETILANVRVLAIDQQIEEQEGGQVVVGKTATLELHPEQAEILALAEELGEISLALRSLEDSTPEDGGPQVVEGIGNSSSSVTMMKFGRTSRVRAQ